MVMAVGPHQKTAPSSDDVEQLQWPEMLKFPQACLSECRRIAFWRTKTSNNSSVSSAVIWRSDSEFNHAESDADVLIVSSALKAAETCNTFLMRDDTDMIILLYHHVTSNHMIFFHPKPKSGESERYMDIRQVQSVLNKVCQCLLFASHIRMRQHIETIWLWGSCWAETDPEKKNFNWTS